jgi:uncharacterized protein (TIGR00369 family)
LGSNQERISVLVAHTIALPVGNLGRATAFYADALGMELVFSADGEASLRGGGCEIGLPTSRSDHDAPASASAVVELISDEPLDVVMKRLSEAGVTFGDEESRRGLRFIPFQDIDGNHLALVEAPSWHAFARRSKGDAAETMGFLDSLALRWPTLTPETVAVELDLDDQFRGPSGALLGAVVATIIDIAAATLAVVAGGDLVTTTSMTVHYLGPGRIGPVRAEAVPLRVGRRQIATQVRVCDLGSDTLMAVGVTSLTRVRVRND